MPTERGAEVLTCRLCGIADDTVYRPYPYSPSDFEHYSERAEHHSKRDCIVALKRELTALQSSRDAAERIGDNKAVSEAVARDLAKRFGAFDFDHCDVATRTHWLAQTYHVLQTLDAARGSR